MVRFLACLSDKAHLRFTGWLASNEAAAARVQSVDCADVAALVAGLSSEYILKS